MSVLRVLLPSLLILAVAVGVVLPWGGGKGARYVLPLLPFMMAYLFLARSEWWVPSPVVFASGLLLDIVTEGPLGYWPLVYLTGVLIARQLPESMLGNRLLRLSSLLLIVFVLAGVQVGVAALYHLRWVDWSGVLAGTLVAAGLTAVVDLAWPGGGAARALNVTERVSRPGR